MSVLRKVNSGKKWIDFMKVTECVQLIVYHGTMKKKEKEDMWSKTRKALYDRLAPSLQGRVIYDVQSYQHLKCRCGTCADNDKQFLIILDKEDKNTIAGAGAFFHDWGFQCGLAGKLKEEGRYTQERLDNQMFYHTGLMLFSKVMPRVHQYLNVVGIEECLNSEDYFLYLLAIFDRRVGKRRIRQIYEAIDSEPEWIRKFILFRAQAEGIIK